LEFFKWIGQALGRNCKTLSVKGFFGPSDIAIGLNILVVLFFSAVFSFIALPFIFTTFGIPKISRCHQQPSPSLSGKFFHFIQIRLLSNTMLFSTTVKYYYQFDVSIHIDNYSNTFVK
jgi:hypothetical protein